jgi:olfactory receptor
MRSIPREHTIGIVDKYSCILGVKLYTEDKIHIAFFFKRCPSNVTLQNLTVVTEFHLMPLSEDQEQQTVLFGLFLSMYLLTVFGNLLIILAVSLGSHFHTPMYFLLLNLSLDDICFISTMVPKLIVNVQAHGRVISYVGCLTQMSLYIIFGNMDAMLLAVMAYDHFVAICHPLHYSVIMNPRLCVFLVFMSLLFSLLDSQVHDIIVLQCNHFKAVEISNFFCDPSKLLNLACSDNSKNNIVMYFVVTIMGFLPVSGIFFSYYKILSSILKVKSIGGRYKAFSTCGSHLTIVCLFYGTGLGV